MSERVLDEETWPDEANAVIHDIKNHVREAKLSDVLTNTNKYIYINLTTLEDRKYCIEMTARGFRIVAQQHNSTDLSESETKYFETPYSLLQSISAEYGKSFDRELIDKLQALQDGD